MLTLKAQNHKIKMTLVPLVSICAAISFILASFIDVVSIEEMSVQVTVATWLFSFVLMIPVFLIVNFIIACLASLVISLIEPEYYFKRVYMSFFYFNSIQLFVIAFLVFLLMNFEISPLFVVLVSCTANILILFMQRKSIIQYACVKPKAANILMGIGCFLACLSLIGGLGVMVV